MTHHYYEGIQHIVYISTNIGTWCEHCGSVNIGMDKFAESVNHYIENHGYKLLHVGQESKETDKGNPISDTIAVLGK